jgi:SdrD B-like domain
MPLMPHARHLRMNTIRRVLALAGSLMLLLQFSAIPVFANPTTVSGRIYYDNDGSGQREIAAPRREAGAPSIQINAYGPGDAPIATATSAADGTYTLSVPVPAGTEVRLEFVVPTDGLQSGPFGTGGTSSTTVTFVRTPISNVDLGVHRPSQYCQQNPTLATNCYVFGDQFNNAATNNLSVLIDVPTTAGAIADPATPTTSYDLPGVGVHDLDIPAQAIGPTWGLAYQRSTDSLFASAFTKRHVGFGAGGSGAIYRLTNVRTNPNASASSLFLDLDSLFGADSAGSDLRPANSNVLYYLSDTNAYDAVGKVALGGLSISEDDRTLYALNLADRQLYEIPITDVGGVPTPPTLAAQIRRTPIPEPAGVVPAQDRCPVDPATPVGEVNRNLRPFAVQEFAGLVYVGIVCTAESTQNVADLHAYVYTFSPASGAFANAPALSFSLDYPRGCADTFDPNCESLAAPVPAPAEWRPWTSTPPPGPNYTINPGPAPNEYVINPQPWLTGITFDNNDMVIGIRDRLGDQIGSQAPAPNTLSPLYIGVTAGDMMRACRTSATTWTLESNASCGGVTSSGVWVPPARQQGPSGGEFYVDDNPAHDEIAIGGVAAIPGTSLVAQTVNDPIPYNFQTFDAGVQQYDNTDGSLERIYRFFNGSRANIVPGNPPPPLFGKTNGLGDLEVLCAAAPIEIGNRVWFDTDANGRQDPGETPVASVTLNLYRRNTNGTFTLVGTTLTGPNGEYIFNASNVPGGVQPFTDYEIRLDNASDYTAGPLLGQFPTRAAAQASQRDSNGIWNGSFVSTALRTGPAGYNDHTFDFGFVVPTAVELSSFTATSGPTETQLKWATTSEQSTWGYHLYRSTSPNREDATRITAALIPARGRDGGGATYTWVATDAIVGPDQYYWLQEVELNGRTQEYGPVKARPPSISGRNYMIALPQIR